MMKRVLLLFFLLFFLAIASFAQTVTTFRVVTVGFDNVQTGACVRLNNPTNMFVGTNFTVGTTNIYEYMVGVSNFVSWSTNNSTNLFLMRSETNDFFNTTTNACTNLFLMRNETNAFFIAITNASTICSINASTNLFLMRSETNDFASSITNRATNLFLMRTETNGFFNRITNAAVQNATNVMAGMVTGFVTNGQLAVTFGTVSVTRVSGMLIPGYYTWTTRSAGGYVTYWGATCATNFSSLYVATQYEPLGGIICSTNAGTNWFIGNGPPVNHAYFNPCCSYDGKIVAVGDGDNGYVYVSTNYGINFYAGDVAKPWLSMACSSDGQRMMAGASSDSIYSSTDTGKTWTATTAPVGTWYGLSSSSNCQTIACADYGGKVNCSTNFGTNWFAGDSPTYAWACTATSADGNRIYAVHQSGGSDSIYTSTNRGNNWTSLSGYPSGLGWMYVACSPDGTKVAVSDGSGSGYVWHSADSGVSWYTEENSGGGCPWVGLGMASDGSLVSVVNGNCGIDVQTGVFTPDAYDVSLTGDIVPDNNTYYIGKNSSTDRKAFKGVILKDTSNGNYYRIEVVNGVVTATAF